MVAKIRYRRLNPSRKEFRLLELQPAHAIDEQVVCQLVTLPLSDDLEFIALSSLYGHPKETDTIVVNGQSMTITAQLAQALKHVRTVFFPTVTMGTSASRQGYRKPDKRTPRWLRHLLRGVRSILPDPDREAETPLRIWLDALCINQQDEREKLSQHTRMGQIYASAKMVVGWLGLKSPQSDAGLAVLKEIDAAMPRDWGDPGDSELHPENYSPYHRWAKKIQHIWQDREDGQPAFYADHWVGANDFMNRPFFQRGWILEEVAMARYPAFLIGDAIVSWRLVLRINRFMEEFKEAESDLFPARLRAMIQELPLGTIHALLDEFVRRRRLDGMSVSDADGTRSIASSWNDR